MAQRIMRIAFFWFGFDGRYGHWNDGLKAALKIIETEHDVKYYDVTDENIKACKRWKPDVVLFWEAPCTQYSKDAEMWQKVVKLPFPKCLLFAGGPLKAIDVKDFNLIFVESQINEDDCERQGIPYKRAFGTNTNIFKPIPANKRYDAFMQATFADWKRHALFAQAMGDKGCVAGRVQQFDRNGYNECIKRRVHVFDEQTPQQIAAFIAESHCVLNTANAEGGGQRCTLEAMACGVPVIVMEDSSKNCEFVRESSAGIICKPDPEAIREAIKKIKEPNEYGEKGLAYIQKKWTQYHYANALLAGVQSIL